MFEQTSLRRRTMPGFLVFYLWLAMCAPALQAQGSPLQGLEIHATVDNAHPRSGDIVEISLTVHNNSDSTAATGVLVEYQLPAGLRYVSSQSFLGNKRSEHIWYLGTLLEGASASLQVFAQVETAEPGITLRSLASVHSDLVGASRTSVPLTVQASLQDTRLRDCISATANITSESFISETYSCTANTINLGPTVTVHPSATVNLTADSVAFNGVVDIRGQLGVYLPVAAACVDTPALECKTMEWPSGVVSDVPFFPIDEVHAWSFLYDNHVGQFQFVNRSAAIVVGVSTSPGDFTGTGTLTPSTCIATVNNIIDYVMNFAPAGSVNPFDCELENGQLYFLNVKLLVPDSGQKYTLGVI